VKPLLLQAIPQKALRRHKGHKEQGQPLCETFVVTSYTTKGTKEAQNAQRTVKPLCEPSCLLCVTAISQKALRRHKGRNEKDKPFVKPLLQAIPQKALRMHKRHRKEENPS